MRHWWQAALARSAFRRLARQAQIMRRESDRRLSRKPIRLLSVRLNVHHNSCDPPVGRALCWLRLVVPDTYLGLVPRSGSCSPAYISSRSGRCEREQRGLAGSLTHATCRMEGHAHRRDCIRFDGARCNAPRPPLRPRRDSLHRIDRRWRRTCFKSACGVPGAVIDCSPHSARVGSWQPVQSVASALPGRGCRDA